MTAPTAQHRASRQSLRRLAENHTWLLAYAVLNSAPSPAGGRPPAAFPRKSYSCRMSAGELKLLDLWQARLSPLVGRALSRGETAGFLATLIQQQYRRLQPAPPAPASFDDLLAVLLKAAHERKQRLRKLAEAYPYIGMYVASLEDPARRPAQPGSTPRQNYSLRLTRGESNVIDGWQELFSGLLPNKPQRGETIGLLAWIAAAQYEDAVRNAGQAPGTLSELLLFWQIED